MMTSRSLICLLENQNGGKLRKNKSRREQSKLINNNEQNV
jgi:hypothetical protein